MTSASDGIGRALATQIAGRGLNVVLVARRVDALDALAAELRAAHGVEAVVHPADLSDRDAASAIHDAHSDKEIGLAALCAGFGTSGRFETIDLQDEMDMIDVNCTATLIGARHAAQAMIPRGRGGLILMSSLLAFQGAARAANYAATKAYVQTLAEGLAVELRAHGIDVLASAPGPTASGFGTRSGIDTTSGTPPEVVARETLDALGRRGTVRPTWGNRMLAASLNALPRARRVALLQRAMQDMIAS